MTAEAVQTEFNFEARVGEQSILRIRTGNLSELTAALVHFNLVSTNQAPAETAQVEAVVEEAPAPKAEKVKKAKPEKAAPAPTPAVEEPAQPEPAQQEPAAASPSEPEAVKTDDTVAKTPAEAAEAVRAYGAKNGIVAARELLQKHGFARTGDITADKAGALFAEASA
jgi:outer membrane biosynthesis protein TonB